jgi:hypothetical protein
MAGRKISCPDRHHRAGAERRDPVIHHVKAISSFKGLLDCRVKPGNDGNASLNF